MSWNDRYLADDFPWDLGRPAPILSALAAEELTTPCRVIVPGCGRGWDVEALAEAGHDAVGLDVAPAAIEQARARLAKRGALAGAAEFRVGDVLKDAGEQAFDAWVEHTCYCIFAPGETAPYVEAAARALRPGGVLFGAFLDFEGGGPPWGTNAAAVRADFEKHFVVERLERVRWRFEPADVPQLAGVFRRRG